MVLPADVDGRRREADRLVVTRLFEVGVNCDSVYDLVMGPTPAAAVPVLLDLLEVIEEPVIAEGIVRALRTNAAKKRAEESLIALFRRLPSGPTNGLKWAIGNTLGGLDRQRYAAELLELALDKAHRSDRQMIVDALATVKGGEITQALVDLLGDDEVNGHAIGALRRRHAREALPALKGFEDHPSVWKRKIAARAILAITRYHASRH